MKVAISSVTDYRNTPPLILAAEAFTDVLLNEIKGVMTPNQPSPGPLRHPPHPGHPDGHVVVAVCTPVADVARPSRM
jgi:hypothetical protein